MSDIICRIFGHRPPDKIVPVYAFTGKWTDKNGNPVCFHARICERCYKRIPASEEDAIEKDRKTAEISAAMNSSRARYGLKPISWET